MNNGTFKSKLTIQSSTPNNEFKTTPSPVIPPAAIACGLKNKLREMAINIQPTINIKISEKVILSFFNNITPYI